MQNYNIKFEDRNAFIQERGLVCYDIVHTPNFTRTIYKCKNLKGYFCEIGFYNKGSDHV